MTTHSHILRLNIEIKLFIVTLHMFLIYVLLPTSVSYTKYLYHQNYFNVSKSQTGEKGNRMLEDYIYCTGARCYKNEARINY